MGHEIKCYIFHGKFMAINKAMKFHFAVFRGHEMPFMGYSQKIHGIFIKLWFIVQAVSVNFSSPGLDIWISRSTSCCCEVMFSNYPHSLKKSHGFRANSDKTSTDIDRT